MNCKAIVQLINKNVWPVIIQSGINKIERPDLYRWSHGFVRNFKQRQLMKTGSNAIHQNTCGHFSTMIKAEEIKQKHNKKVGDEQRILWMKR